MNEDFSPAPPMFSHNKRLEDMHRTCIESNQAEAKDSHLKREVRAVPSAFAGEGAALCYATRISAATGRKSSCETAGCWSQ